MSVDLVLAPKRKRLAGEPCCEPVVYPDVERGKAARMAVVAKALGDPVRLQLVDVLRKHAGKVCVCELVPLFEIAQPTLSHHLKKLREAGIVDSERRGLWAYYYVNPRSAGGSLVMAELTDTREAVRERYAAAARAAAEGQSGACCGSAEGCGSTTLRAEEVEVFGERLYQDGEREGATDTAVAASMGCGVPTAVADLHEGETVLDLGSGAGADVLISARRVGPTGRAIGVDMTDEMLELARQSANEAGAQNVEFVKGTIERLPLADASVDVVISNCVINLSGDKPAVLREAARVLRPGGASQSPT